MLSISDLSVQYGGNYLFDAVSFTINDNDKIGIIGRNGSGKSTLMKIIVGEKTPETGNVHSSAEYKIGYLPQELRSDSSKSVFNETASALVEIRSLERRRNQITNEIATRSDYETSEYMQLIHKLSEIDERYNFIGGHSDDADIEQVLIGLGFERSDFHRPVSEFSGGWQMRIELAKILLAHPDCILLDEPTNHLDIDSIRWLEVFLKNYSGAVLIISHDRTFLDNVTNRTIEISLGKIYTMNLPYSQFMEARKEQREYQMNAYRNQQRQIAQTERFIERFRAKATLASRTGSKLKLLNKIERIEVEQEDLSSVRFHFPEPPRSSRLIVEVKNLTKTYDGIKNVLKNVNFAIEREERIAFVGKNGEGKTTLAKIFAGLEDYDGELNLGGNVVLSYFAQHQADMLSGDMSVFDVIDNAAVGDMRQKVRTLLGAFLFSGDNVYKKVRVLSGGEKARLALCKMLLTPANFIIMDEPTNHLDMMAKDVLKNALMDYKGTLLVVSHDREFLSGLTNKTIEFKHRHIKEFLGDINYYLETNKISMLQELERKVQTQTIPEKEKITTSKNQQNWKEQKSQQTKINRLAKQISQTESEIEEIEQKIAEIEKLFQNTEFMSTPQNVIEKNNQFNTLQQQLQQKTSQWEDLIAEQEEISSD